MNVRRLQRASVAATAALAVVLTGSGLALAAPPNRTPTPVITSSPAATTNSTSASFSFTDTNVSAVFSCSRDGVAYAVCTSPVTYTGLAAGSHQFSVKATAPGLKGSSTVTKSWTIDLTAPNVPTVSQPATPTKNTSASISFSSSSTDIQSYLCSIDGAADIACTSPKSVTVAEGYHTFAVKAVDKATNVSAAKTVAWVVDLSTPQPVISSGPPTVTSATSAGFTFDSTEPGVTFSCSIDSTTTYTACSPPKAYSSLAIGTHTVRVRATDAAGNVATSDPYTWKIQAVAPISLTWSNSGALPSSVTTETDGTFDFTATGQTTLACRLDGVDEPTCTSPGLVSGLADGAHTYTLVADSGLASEVQLRFAWTVDTVAPDAPTVTGPTGIVASPDADITVTPASVSDVIDCELDSVSIDCSAPFTASGLADGAHTFSAIASDEAGNAAESDLNWTVDTTGPQPSVTAPGSLSGSVKVEFDEDATGVSSDSVYLTTDTAALVTTTMTCFTSADASTPCDASDIARVDLTPDTRLLLGGYYSVSVNPASAATVVDGLGNVSGATTDAFRAATTVDESSTALSYSWRKV
ncbi:MAG TPA: hypothetical protein VMT88_07935, partial [Actinomycetes bacterium]|nr:hypothetical protein [Actinomycetes bacterium]